MITVDNLTCSFGRRHRVTPLDRISATFADGRVSYVLGLNGTGKSTLLRLLCGVRRPTAGTVTVTGGGTGMFLDTAAVQPGHTGRRHLRWIAAACGVDPSEVERSLTEVGLTRVADDHVAGYSLGMRQRLGIAGALLGNPRNVVLDEPLNGLDIAGMLWLRRLLRDLADDGRCVIVASHHLAEVESSADDLVVLEAGHVVASGAVGQVCRGYRHLEDAVLELIPRAAEAGQVRR